MASPSLVGQNVHQRRDSPGLGFSFEASGLLPGDTDKSSAEARGMAQLRYRRRRLRQPA
jgi:hypothetical protein